MERKQKMKRKVLPEKPKMKRKVKAVSLPPVKRKGLQVMIRKDGKPNCFVCYKKLTLLRQLRQMKEDGKEHLDAYTSLRLKVNNTIVRLPSNSINPLYRHVKCEAGTANHSKNKRLKKHFEKMLKE